MCKLLTDPFIAQLVCYACPVLVPLCCLPAVTVCLAAPCCRIRDWVSGFFVAQGYVHNTCTDYTHSLSKSWRNTCTDLYCTVAVLVPCSLMDQLEWVFSDADLVPLLVQENYANYLPDISNSMQEQFVSTGLCAGCVYVWAGELCPGLRVSRPLTSRPKWPAFLAVAM
jgi:hypothetical protein